VEKLVTDPLERAFLEIDEITTVESTSRSGIAVLSVEAASQVKNLTRVWDDVRERAADIRGRLPQSVVSISINDRFRDVAALVLGVTWDGADDRQREDLAKRLRDRVRRLPDVAEARLVGEQEERIYLSLSTRRMAQLAVTPALVAQAVAQRNVLPASGGSLASGGARLSIEPTGNLRSEGELGSIVVASLDGAPVYLRDVATISRGYADPPPLLMRVSGTPAVGVSITQRKGRNVTALGRAVEKELASMRAELPAGAAITVLNDLPRSVQRRIGGFFENLVAGLLLILVVMYLFLGLRVALLVGVMLLLTILGTFGAMLLLGRDLQQISIAALIIALGLVVDNSIVVLDNIERKLSGGIDRVRAAVEGTDELRVPLLTSNLTTVASFAPLTLLPGPLGEFIRDLGGVTSLATLVSLLYNLTLMPLIAMRFLRTATSDQPNRLRRAFMRLVDGMRDIGAGLAERGLRRPVIPVGIALWALLVAVVAIPQLGLQFFPAAERNQFTVDVWLPEGRDILATERTAARVERIIARQPDVTSFVTYVGQGGPRFYYNVAPEPPTPNYAQIVVNTRSIEDTRRLVAAVQQEADQTISEARVTARTLEQGPPVGAPIAIRVSGNDLAHLRGAAARIKAILNTTPGAISVHDDYGELPLALKVDVDADRAALAGLTSADVAQATQMGFTGQTVSYLRQGDKEIPILMRADPAERSGADSVADLYLSSSTGAAVPLRQVASVSLAPQEGRIVRRNQVRALTVFAYSDGARLPLDILADARPKIAALELPRGCSIAYAGEEEEVGESFTEMRIILGLTVVANLLIVLLEFNSFAIALTIMAAVPFGIIGAILGLILTRLPFGFMAFLGITSLGGVVTNHAIVLFEYALEEQRRGLPLEQALIEAGRKRLRPILLTVVLAIGGLLPQALNGGSLWPPMAWSLIFGLLMSLVLTLVVVPSFYKLLTRRRGRKLAERVDVPAVSPARNQGVAAGAGTSRESAE
jgi:multidrug efflux pump subunit AcrB